MAKQDKSMTPEYILQSAAQQKLGEGEDLSKKPALKSLAAAMAKIEKEQQSQTERKASMGSELRSAIVPQMTSVSNLQQIQQPTPSVEAQSQVETGKKGVLDNILNYSKISSDNSTLLVSLTKDIKTLNEKSIEDNKELFERLLKSNDALKTSMEENMRESARARGTGGGAIGTGSSEEGGGGDNKGGGLPDWLKTAAGVAAGGIGAKVLGKAAKRFGGEAAAKGMAGLKGFGKGALKAGGIGALGLLGYTMSSQDIKDKLGEYGIDENAIGAAGVAGTLGYGAYKARQGMDTAGKIIAENKPTVEKPEVKPEPKTEPKVEKKEPQPRDEKGRFTKKEPPAVDPTKGAAEAAKSSIAKEAGEAAGKTAGKTAGKEAIKKAIGKVASSKAVATVAKKIPIIGALAGLWFATGRAMAGDYKGATAEAVSGVAGATGVGAVPSLAIDAGLMARDVYKELYGTFPEDDESDLRNSRISEIQTEVTDYVKSLVPQNQDSSTGTPLQPLDDMSGSAVTPETPKVEPSTPSKFKSGASDVVSPQSDMSTSQVTPQLSQSVKTEAISQAGGQTTNSSPIIVNKGGDTINNITNTSGGGSGGAAGTPSRIPNPWDNQVFGNPWVAYP